jgi:hypothetical protein
MGGLTPDGLVTMRKTTAIGFYKQTSRPIILHLELDGDVDFILSRANMALYQLYGNKMPSVNWVCVLDGHLNSLTNDWQKCKEIKGGKKDMPPKEFHSFG